MFTFAKQTIQGAALAGLLLLTSCSSSPVGDTISITAAAPGVPGGANVETYTTKATVTAIDLTARKVTLRNQDGSTSTFKAPPEAVNLPQLKVGDVVTANVVKEVVVFVRKPGVASTDGVADLVALSPLGEKPGITTAKRVEITGKVKSIDAKRRKATLTFADGSSKTFDVRQDIDLSAHHPGEEVVFRTTEATIISVAKP